MADEAVMIKLLGNQGDPVEIIVEDDTPLVKGTLMQLTSSPKTCTATDGASQIFMGVLTHEKTATDGVTKMSVWTHGLFVLTCGAGETMVLGAPVMTGAAANEVDVATDNTVEGSAMVVGLALETVGNNGTGVVLINVGRQL